MGTIDLTKRDLCKSCKHYWVDFVVSPEKRYIARCEILDKKYMDKELDEEVPYPCLKCPFGCYTPKKK